MSATGDVRPPNRLGTLVAGYFDDEDDAKKAIDSLKEEGFQGDQIGVAMRADEIPKHEKWISEIREELGKPETLPETTETTRQTFAGLGLEDRAAAHFEDKLDEGGVVIGVRTEASRADEAAKCLEDNDGDVAREALEVPVRERVPEAMRTERAGEGRHIQLMGEMLRAHKERINRGDVRLRKETVTENQTINVPVSREEVVVERHAASGEAPEGRIGENKEIRIPVSEERVSVEKQPMVTGEVDVKKREVTGSQPVSGEVRHEELRVEKEGDVESAVDDRTNERKAA